MKLLLLILPILSFTLPCTFVKAAEIEIHDQGWVDDYLDFISNYDTNNSFPIYYSLYDIDGNGVPELFLQETEYQPDEDELYTIYSFFKISKNEVNKAFSFKHTFGDNVSFFVSSVDGQPTLIYGFCEHYWGGSVKYYGIYNDDGGFNSQLLGEIKSKNFPDGVSSVEYPVRFIDEFIYKASYVTETEFLEKFKNQTPLKKYEAESINKQAIQKNYHSNMYTEISEKKEKINNSAPFIHTDVKMNVLQQLYNYFKYPNSIYEIYPESETRSLLMINGNFIPRAKLIEKEHSTFIPLRTLCNYTEKNISWNAEDKSVIITDDNSIMEICVNSMNADNKYRIVDNSVYVNLEAINDFGNLSVSDSQTLIVAMDYVKIISIENVFFNSETFNVEEAEIQLKNRLMGNNIYYVETIGRYYVFGLDTPQKILFNKYTGDIFLYNGTDIEVVSP